MMANDVSVTVVATTGDWRSAADSADLTVDRAPGTNEPSDAWKNRMLLAEHSPIRKISFDIVLHNLQYWVSVHLVRHKFGVEHWVRSQRSDRTGIPRDDLPQGARVDHEILANAQALIFISRKRLCACASPETRTAWYRVKEAVAEKDPVMARAMVPDCVYRGWCYEMHSCGYYLTDAYKEALTDYRRSLVVYREQRKGEVK